MMNALPSGISQLSPEEKRALLAKLLREKAKKNSSLPLSFEQQRLWFWDRLEPNSALYNMPAPLRLRGDLKVSALEQALNSVVARHEAIRTRFENANGSPVQVVYEAPPIPLEVVDLSTQADPETAVRQKVETHIRQPFDLTSDLLLRAQLFRLGPEDHVLSICLHHIASDAVSLGILFKELSVFYQAEVAGTKAALPPLPIQYSDYAIWQRQWLQGEVLQQQVSYWKKQLSDVPLLELPLDHARPANSTYRGHCKNYLFPAGLGEAVKAISRREGATLFMTLLAGFNAFLHRYTGQEDFAVGTPIAGRTRMETEGLIGFFVNTLVLRTPLSSDLSFRQLLKRVKETTLGAMANQDVPFEKLVEELKPERSPSYSPFVQVVFALQNAPMDPENFSGLEIKTLDLHTGTSKFDFTVLMKEAPDGIRATVEFKADLFEDRTVDRMVQHFQQLLQSAVASPDEKISRLSLLSETDRQQIVHDWNQTATPYPKQKTIGQLFEEQAAQRPGTTAVVCGKKSLTYGELNQRANHLAHLLKSKGIGRGSLVGLYLERDLDLMVGLLGILKAGAAYLPLDLAYPEDRIAFMLEDSVAPVVLTQTRLLGQFPGKKTEIICLDQLQHNSTADSNPPNINQPDDPAYVIYTSGSTGKPKGSTIPHHGVTRLVKNTNYISLGPEDRVGQISTISFDAATFEIWGALLNGGTLVIFPKDLLLSLPQFAKEFQEEKISAFFVTTALFNQMAADFPGAFKSLKYLLFGGEACDPGSVRNVLQHGPPRHLLHVYGPTESTTFATWHEVVEVPDHATTIPIGRPISNTRLYVLDREKQPVPIGIPGELYLAGDGLALEYLKRPELTAEKFVTSPSLPHETRLYRTGDLVRYLEDGSIEFLGRIDQQVKIRGFRIELGEIEAALTQHPGIREASVTVIVRKGGDKQLVAYVVPAEGQVFLQNEIRRSLKSRLPDFMVPSIYVQLSRLPLTPNGKVDRRALPAPEADQPSGENNYLAPRNPWEQKLAAIWENVLGRSRIGMTENFFDLGGHSLLGVRLFMQIEKTFGKSLPVGTLFQAPTIEKLAQALREDKVGHPGSSLIEIQPNGFKPPIFWLHTLGGGGGGGLFTYRKLAGHLGPDQPSFGLVAPVKPHSNLPEMAAHYLREIKILQPEGPYYLGGYCFGGVIAFEMAQQLTTAGEKVALLALLESVPPNIVRNKNISAKNFPALLENLRDCASEFLRQPGEEQLLRLKRKAVNIKRRLSHFLGKKNGTSIHPALDEVIDMSQYPKDYKTIAQIHWKALGQYEPQPYAGTVSLFRTRKQELFNFDQTLGWGNVARQVDLIFIPGAHESLLNEPHVNVLAAELLKVLTETQQQNPSFPA